MSDSQVSDPVTDLAWELHRAAGASSDRGVGPLYVTLAGYVLERYVPKDKAWRPDMPTSTAYLSALDRHVFELTTERDELRRRIRVISGVENDSALIEPPPGRQALMLLEHDARIANLERTVEMLRGLVEAEA